MAERLVKGSTLKSWADAIRTKRGITDKLDPANFASEILSINRELLEAPSIQIMGSNLYIFDESEKAENFTLHYEEVSETSLYNQENTTAIDFG